MLKRYLSATVYYIKYLIFKSFLIIKGYKNVSPLSMNNWHHGVCCIVATDSKNRKVFIKSAGKYKAALREHRCLTTLGRYGANNTPEAYCFYNILSTSLVVMEFIESSINDLSLDVTKSEFKLFAKEIVVMLHDCGIVHRDIRPDNILLSDGKLYLIDFGWAIIDKEKFNDYKFINELKALGCHYKPTSLSWDDSFSLSTLYNELYKETLILESKINYSYE